MSKTKWLAVLYVLLVAGVPCAQAQMLKWEDRGYVMINLGVQTQSQTFSEVSSPEIYGENASITVPHHVGSGLLFDLSGGYRIWKNLAVGIGFSRFSDSEQSTVDAQIPNPILFNAHRSATASTGKMSHSSTGILPHVLWMLPLTDKIEVAAIIGPAFFHVSQDLVSNLTTTEGPPPFGTVTISSVQLATASKWATGVNAGLDVTYLVTKKYGAGGFIRWAGGSADLPVAGGGTITVDGGGFQLGAGFRYRF